MRIEQVIAAITRNVVNATVREIEAAMLFVNAASLHLWQQRKPLGMSVYSGSLSGSLYLGDHGGTGPDDPGDLCSSKRGRPLCQPMLALASCPVGSVRA